METDREAEKPTELDLWDEDHLLDEVGAAFSRLRRRTTQVSVDPAPSRKDLNLSLIHI